jgi:glycosyltransferase 2 family protein
MSLRELARRAWRLLSKHFRTVAAVATVVGVAVALWGQRQALVDFDWRLAPGSFLGAIGLFALAPFVQAFSFWLALRFIHVPARLEEALLLWMRSFLLRYAPSGALAIVIRIRERGRVEATQQEIWAVTAYENLAALCAGAFVSVAAFAAAGSWPPLAAIGIAVVALALAVAVRPAFFRRLSAGFVEKRGLALPTLLRGRLLAIVIAVNSAGWVATGGAAYLLVRALAADAESSFAWITAVYAFAWLLGFVVPLLPGGLGLRDGTLATFLVTRLGTGPATALALALRLANTLGEVVAIGVTEGAYWLLRRVGVVRALPEARA